MRIWLISPKPCSLLNNTKMLQIYIQRVLNRRFKAICISGIIYLRITLPRMNYLKGFCQTHSITRLIRLRRLSLLDCLQLCHNHKDQKDFATHCRCLPPIGPSRQRTRRVNAALHKCTIYFTGGFGRDEQIDHNRPIFSPFAHMNMSS